MMCVLFFVVVVVVVVVSLFVISRAGLPAFCSRIYISYARVI